MEKLGPCPTQLPGLTRYMSFVDESGHAKDPNQRHLCLAGLLATEDAWKNFDVEWRTRCAAAALTKPFHMKDFAARRGEFEAWGEEQRKQLLRELISTIRCAKAIPIGSVVSIEGFNALPPRVRQGFRDPHFLAFQSLTYHIAVAAGIQMEPGPVTMIYAHHPEHSAGLGNTGNCGRRSANTPRWLPYSWNHTSPGSSRNTPDFRQLTFGRTNYVIISTLSVQLGRNRAGPSPSSSNWD